MRRFTALLLAIFVAFQAFYNAGVTTYWLANRAYIAATLCENRDKPELHCDGKCYLKKKVAVEDDASTAPSTTKAPTFKKGIELAECWPETAEKFPVSPAETCSVAPAGQQNRRDFLAEKSVFHPPA